jgi:hypothetical protein
MLFNHLSLFGEHPASDRNRMPTFIVWFGTRRQYPLNT